MPLGAIGKSVAPFFFLSAVLEELHGALVAFRRSSTLERAEIAATPGPRIPLPRVQAIRSRRQLADHGFLQTFPVRDQNATPVPFLSPSR
jgi:hypothetical protein